MKVVRLYKNKDWYCPYCKDLNNTERPEEIVQCSWCLKTSKVSKFEAKEYCLECGKEKRTFMHNCNGTSNMEEKYGCPICDDVCGFC